MANESLSKLHKGFNIRTATDRPMEIKKTGKVHYAKIYPYGTQICAADTKDDPDDFTIVTIKKIPDRELTSQDYLHITKVNWNTAEGIIKN